MTTYWIYHYNPTQGIDDELTRHIIGCQGNLWSEYIWERTDLQYKDFPWSLALSEIEWEQNENKDWTRFINDYVSHEQKILDCLGLVDADLQFWKPGLWNNGELSNKWVSVVFPFNQVFVANSFIEVEKWHTWEM